VRGATEHRVRSYNIAAIPGDGIGQEVVAAAVEVLLACAERDKGFALDFTNFDWGSERYKKFGALMPNRALASSDVEELRGACRRRSPWYFLRHPAVRSVRA
jgi:isocitrate/isopropylmalate dehydrogenase